MAKRLFDLFLAGGALALTSPLWVVACIAIAISSPGPLFYHANRVGRGGHPFRMTKFRTMHVATARQSEITAPGDQRIFPAGRLLRLLKIDELPQLLNILRGEMSVVGPRPEASVIVADHYTDWMRETLAVAPGLTSVGALFNYSYSDELIDPARPEESYVERMLPAKLALERAYLDRASFLGDLSYMVRTGVAILLAPFGRQVPPAARDVRAATQWVDVRQLPAALQGQLARRSAA